MEKVLGLGNALVDIMTKLENDDFLTEQELPKGSMQLVDDIRADQLADASKEMKKYQASGGSAANTIHGLARLGVETGFIGKVGEDELGQFFSNDLLKSKISPHLLKCTTPSGRALALVSLDSERTFATYLGAAINLQAEDLKSDMFEGYKYLHVEGYLVQNHELLRKAAEMAKVNNMKISLDLASYNVVEDNLEFLRDFLSKYVDIVFANEEEAKAYTGKEPEEALHELAKETEIAVVKIGEHGSLIKSGEEQIAVVPIEASPIDTTGAGDAYAAGFLYGLVNNLDLTKCGEIGSLLSGKVIEEMGAKISEKSWTQILEIIKK